MRSHKTGIQDDSRREFIRGSSLLLATALPGGKPASAAAVRLGLVGCGRSGLRLAGEAMQHTSAQVDLVAMADAFGDRVQQAARSLKGRGKERYQVQTTTRFVGPEAYLALLDMDLDAVIVATPHHLRAKIVQASAAAGKHVYVEQPLAIDSNGLRDFLRAEHAAESGQLRIGVGNRVHLRSCEPAVSVIRSQLIGNVECIVAEHRTPALRDSHSETCAEPLRNWQEFERYRGDGTLRHRAALADLALQLLGETPVEARVLSHVAYGDGELDSRVGYEFTSGAQLVSRVHAAANIHSAEDNIVIFGSQGKCDLTRGRFYDFDNRLIRKVAPRSAPRAETLWEFFDHLTGREKKAFNPSGSVRTQLTPGHFPRNRGEEDRFSDECLASDAALSAIMGQLACELGQRQTRCSALRSNFRFPDGS